MAKKKIDAIQKTKKQKRVSHKLCIKNASPTGVEPMTFRPAFGSFKMIPQK